MTSGRRHFSFRDFAHSALFTERGQLAPRLQLPNCGLGDVLALRLEAGMAEIKVEPKRSALGWLWAIIILAVIAVAAWYFMTHSRPVPATTAPADSVRTSLLVPAAGAAVTMEGRTNG